MGVKSGGLGAANPDAVPLDRGRYPRPDTVVFPSSSVGGSFSFSHCDQREICKPAYFS